MALCGAASGGCTASRQSYNRGTQSAGSASGGRSVNRNRGQELRYGVRGANLYSTFVARVRAQTRKTIINYTSIQLSFKRKQDET